MVSCIIRLTEKYENSANVSLQQEHIELFIAGQLRSIVVSNWPYTVVSEYEGQALAKLVGSAITNGRRQAYRDGLSDGFYYLAAR